MGARFRPVKIWVVLSFKRLCVLDSAPEELYSMAPLPENEAQRAFSDA